jgi:cytoskeletal protein CcmA (bactofilin family)
VVCSGAVVIGPGAILKGDVTAPSISIAEGAVLKGKYIISRAK